MARHLLLDTPRAIPSFHFHPSSASPEPPSPSTHHNTIMGVFNNDSVNHTTTTSPLPPSPSALLNHNYYGSLSPDERRKYDFHHQLPGEPSHQVVVAILCLSATVLACSSLVLLATRYTSGGQSGTLVFLRSLLLSDILMAVYGLAKMLILLFLREIRVNFFLPDSLFFTASLASSSSLLSLNLDCFLKLARPFQYAQVSKDRVISVMLIMWNVAFVVGFLPLVGWHDEAYTYRFFSFYPWHFLLFNGLVVLVCVVVCLACMLSLQKFYTLPDTDPSCFSVRTLEIRKYRHLHRTIVMESAMWLASYLPFFVYISLACRQCSLGDYAYKDSTIIYFLPVFLAKSLFSAFLQAVRTFRVHAVMNKLIGDLSHNHNNHNHNNNNNNHHPRHHHLSISTPTNNNNNNNNNDASVSTIAYTNPLCDHPEEQILYSRNNAATTARGRHEISETNHLNQLNHRRRHNHHCHHHHNHHHQHQHDHDDDHHHHDLYPFYSDSDTIDNILRRQEMADRYRLNPDDDNWTLYNHRRHQHHHHHHYHDDDGLTGDDDYDDDGAMMMTTARLEIHGSDENIVGIANLGFRPSIDLHHINPSMDLDHSTVSKQQQQPQPQQQSTKL